MGICGAPDGSSVRYERLTFVVGAATEFGRPHLFCNPSCDSFQSNPLTNELTVMTYTFKLPLTGEITVEGSEDDLQTFALLLRSCLEDAIVYNLKHADCPFWADHLSEVYNCLPDPSPYADPTLDLPF